MGTYTDVSFGEYDGQFVNNKEHGTGTQRYLRGDVYTGQWEDGRRHGEGTYTYANGNVYTGEFSKGEAIDELAFDAAKVAENESVELWMLMRAYCYAMLQ